MKTNKIGDFTRNALKLELREIFTVDWLKKKKGFENISEKKAKEHIESMIELSILLGNFLLAQNIDL